MVTYQYKRKAMTSRWKFSITWVVLGVCVGLANSGNATTPAILGEGFNEIGNKRSFLENISDDGTGFEVFERKVRNNRSMIAKRAFFSGRLSAGRIIYKSRCTLCHGESGEGNGLMSKIIKDPPPSDLTRSTIDKLDMMSIIVNGGATMDRSPQMPPWGDELSAEQLDSLINYLFTLRKSET